jgi:hypothetical protein
MGQHLDRSKEPRRPGDLACGMARERSHQTRGAYKLSTMVVIVQVVRAVVHQESRP